MIAQRRLVALAALIGACASGAAAQELEPGLYQNAPIGVNMASVAYSFSTGNVLFDAALPIEDVTAKVHVVSLGFVRTTSLVGRPAKLDFQIPVSWSHFRGELAGEQRTRSPSGLADPRLRFGVNFVGGRAVTPAQFAPTPQRTVVGVTLQVVVPLGQYDENRLINLGSHRWSFRPEIGLSRARGRVTLEAAAGGWFFTRNNDFFGGSSLRQHSMYFVKGNVIYVFKRNLWVSGSYGYTTGGGTLVDDVPAGEIQRNTRIGLLLSLPATRATSIKIVATSGLTTRRGSDFDSIAAIWQYSWVSRRAPARAARPVPAGTPSR